VTLGVARAGLIESWQLEAKRTSAGELSTTGGKTNGVTLDNDLVMGRWPELGREAKVEEVCNEGSKI
jgi:hypothetical protein